MADLTHLRYGEGVNPSNWVVNKVINAVNFYGDNISPMDIHHVFVPGSWVINQVTPILHVVLILHCYMPIELFFLILGLIHQLGYYNFYSKDRGSLSYKDVPTTCEPYPVGIKTSPGRGGFQFVGWHFSSYFETPSRRGVRGITSVVAHYKAYLNVRHSYITIESRKEEG